MNNTLTKDIEIDKSPERFDMVELPEDNYSSSYTCYLVDNSGKMEKVEASGSFIHKVKTNLEDHLFVGHAEKKWYPIFSVDEIDYNRYRQHVAKCAFIATDGFMSLFGRKLTKDDEIWYENHPSTIASGLKENNTLDCLQTLALKHGLTISEVVLSKGYISGVDHTPYKELFKCNLLSDGSPLFTQEDYDKNFPDDKTEYRFSYANEIIGPAIVFHGKGQISFSHAFQAGGGHASFIKAGEKSKDWEYAIRMAPIEDVPGYEILPTDEYTFEGEIKYEPCLYSSKIGDKTIGSLASPIPIINRPIWGGNRDRHPFRRGNSRSRGPKGRSEFNYDRIYSRTDALSFWLDIGGPPEDFDPREEKLSEFRSNIIWTEFSSLRSMLDQNQSYRVLHNRKINLKRIYKKSNLQEVVELVFETVEKILIETDVEVTVADFALALNKSDDGVLDRLIVWGARACFLEHEHESMV